MSDRYSSHSPGSDSPRPLSKKKEDHIMTTRHYTLEELQKRKEQTAYRIATYEQRIILGFVQ